MSRFKLVLGNYPSSDPCDAHNANGQPLFQSQCAIRLAHALKNSGASFVSFPQTRKCWVHPSEDHVLAAKDLADWIGKKKISFIQSTEEVPAEIWRDKVLDRTGIICFEDYYAPGPGGGGDHIDLWNGSSLTGAGSWLRTRFGIVVPGLWSDFRKSKRVRFFPFT